MIRAARHAIKVINRHKKKEQYMAYAYGVICHFALDMTCHGYVDEKIAESGIKRIYNHSERGGKYIFPPLLLTSSTANDAASRRASPAKANSPLNGSDMPTRTSPSARFSSPQPARKTHPSIAPKSDINLILRSSCFL